MTRVTYVKAKTDNAGAIPEQTAVETEQQAGGEHRQVVKVAESALPTGAATAANQTDGSQRTGILGYRSSDATYQPLRLDRATNSIQIIDYSHHEIHAGSHFLIADVVDLAINNVYDMVFVTPNTTKWIHFTFKLDAESETEWFIYEGAVETVPGAAVTPYNNNRNSATASVATVRAQTNTSLVNANADTNVTAAIALEHGIMGAGKSGGNESRDNEIILKQNTKYCFRAIATAAGYLDFIAQWYEHTDIA
jgi:hypothetical protein